MKYSIMSFAAAILFIMLSVTNLSNFIEGVDKIKIATYETMFSDSVTTPVTLRLKYTGIVVERGSKASIKTYNFTYKFEVNGIEYAGKYATKKMPKELSTNAYYSEADPNCNAVFPQELLDLWKEKSSIWNLIRGLFCVFMAIGFTAFFVDKYRNYVKGVYDTPAK